MEFCRACGTPIEQNAVFCGSCGNQVDLEKQSGEPSLCSSCGAAVTKGQRFCVKCGKNLHREGDSVKPLVSEPNIVLTSTAALKTVESGGPQPAGALLRCLDGVIDVVILLIIGYLVAHLTGQTTRHGFNLHGPAAFFWWGVFACYYIFFEGLKGATPGKMLLSLRVVKEDGTGCDMKGAVIRTVCRIVDHPLLIGVVIMAFSKRKQRLGDHLAGTLVIRNKD